MTLCETNINENKSSTTTNPSSSSSLKWISQPFFHNSDQGKDTKNCFLCTAPHSEFKCSWCQSIYYCSKEHYSHHRVNSKCFPFQRVQKGLETTRNVRKGELLFKETSILSSPDLHSLPTCPVCLKRILSEKRSTSCAQGCPLRLCNGPCARMTREHGPECKILKDNKVKLDFKDYQTPMSINSVITVLRLMESKKKRPSDWKEFLDPNSIHMEERKKAKGEWEFLQKEVVNYIRNRLFMASDVGDEELHLLIGLFVIHSTPLGPGGGKAIFPIFSLIEYDCIGNVHFSIDASNACISLKASHDIEKGQRMTVNFSPSVLGTLKRRKRLKSLYFFDCTCMRCRDPTELDTYVSAIICEFCSKGIMLPNAPLNPLSEWSCSDCEFLLSNSDAERIIDSSEDELTEISMMKCCKRLKDYIEHYEGKILHTNHYLLLLAKRNYVLISRKEKISSLAKSKDPRESKLELPKKKELYEDFWWIIERLGIQDCF